MTSVAKWSLPVTFYSKYFLRLYQLPCACYISTLFHSADLIALKIICRKVPLMNLLRMKCSQVVTSSFGRPNFSKKTFFNPLALELDI